MASAAQDQSGSHDSPVQAPAPPPTSPVQAGSAKKEKGRVRWGADTVSSPPILTLDGTDDEHEPKIDSPDVGLAQLRPSVLRNNSYNSVTSVQSNDEEDPDCEKVIQARYAQERANHVAATLLSPSFGPDSKSRRTSFDSTTEFDYGRLGAIPDGSSVPLHDLSRHHNHHAATDDETAQLDRHMSAQSRKFHEEAKRLVRSHTLKAQQMKQGGASGASTPRPGHVTPPDPADPESQAWLPQPGKYRDGVLSSIMRLYQHQENDKNSPGPSSRAPSGAATPGSSGTATPTKKKWQKNRSPDTISTLVGASRILAGSPGGPNNQSSLSLATTLAGSEKSEKPSGHKKHKRNTSSRFFSNQRGRAEEEVYITIHIAETISRQRYIVKLCKALMVFGAPTHRLEEYLRMTARVLEIDGQFLYLPGCMLISFDDRSTHTADVKIVRTSQGIELGRLEEIHEIYKNVVHDKVGVDEASEKLNNLIEQKQKYPLWVRILAYGAASAFVGPFAFGGRAIDMPVCFFLGLLVGFLQLYVSPRSELYNNVFEVTAAILTSFIARAFGSINNGSTFCFSAMAQSSIALILPGYFVLCSALELQSKAIVPGSIRMVYSIIYSLFLGFGITVGTVLFGAFVPHATSQTQCENPMNSYVAFATVPAFTICLALVNQAKWRQMLLQVPIATAGYVVSFFWTKRFPFAPQLGNMMAAFGIGLIANLYSRLVKGVAVVALLPAIFVQVPSGLSASGSLLSGLRIANQITQPAEPVNGTTSVPINPGGSLDGMVFSVAASMIQIAVGITIGLFLSALVVYPTFGIRHKRSGLFTL